jgi:ornithine cyclodeaminase/alanine dehydrogenase-like protein (mu-crystallin family)
VIFAVHDSTDHDQPILIGRIVKQKTSPLETRARSILHDSTNLISSRARALLSLGGHLLTVRLLTEDDVRNRLEPQRVIAAIEAAFRDRYPTTVIPARSHLKLAAGVFLIMPCYDRARRGLGMKLVVVEDKPQRPDDRVQATYMLLEPTTGRPKLTVSANFLTDLRTAATSAVATRFLAREDVRTLGVFGTGRQARAHLRVLPLVRRFDRVLVCGTSETASRNFAQELSPEIRPPLEPADARTCTADSDVICACTNSPTPLFDGKWLRPGTHLNLVGAFRPHTREVDSATVRRSQVFVETYDGVLAEAGDLLLPMQEGILSRERIAGDLHELVSGKKQGRKDAGTITLFKSVGCALEDLVTAELLSS